MERIWEFNVVRTHEERSWESYINNL